MGFPNWLKELLSKKTPITILNTTKKFSIIYENSNYSYAHFYLKFQTDIEDETCIFKKIIKPFKFYYLDDYCNVRESMPIYISLSESVLGRRVIIV